MTEQRAAAGSAINASTIAAYEETDYFVFDKPAFTLRVGRASTELLAAHARHRVTCSGYVTACNPFSRPVSDAENRERNDALEGVLRERGLQYLRGIGQHPSNPWPGEPSYLVFGLDLEASKALGRQMEQNAIVWAGADAVPALVLLRSGQPMRAASSRGEPSSRQHNDMREHRYLGE